MRMSRLLTLAAPVLVLAACNPFNRDPVTEVSRDMNLNSRWNASLVTPAALAGAVQVNGRASMQPNGNADRTDFDVSIANATPGGVHPWQVRRGQCGADFGAFGATDSFRPLKIDDEGRGVSRTTVQERTPTTGDYSVVVYASAANPTVLACGNLAPPAR